MNTQENMHSGLEGNLSDKEAAFLASLPKDMPFRVPNNYFDTLHERINQEIFLNSLSLNGDSPFNVPAGYFEELNSQITARVGVENLKQLVPADGFVTPDSYFDELRSRIVNQTYGNPPAKKTIKLWHREAMKYVSAACLFIIVASGLYVRQQQEARQIASNELVKEHVLYDIDESVILEHIVESQTASTNTSLSPTEMENYILDNFSTSDLSSDLKSSEPADKNL